jgi:hypothetical protein
MAYFIRLGELAYWNGVPYNSAPTYDEDVFTEWRKGWRRAAADDGRTGTWSKDQ